MPGPLHASCRVGEERVGYIPGEQIALYREVVRLHAQLSKEVARYQNQIHAPSGRALPRVHAGD
jgi:hypothetical protein